MLALMTKHCTFTKKEIVICCVQVFKRNYLSSNTQPNLNSKTHPYKQIHPWNSLEQFSKYLLDNMIYNQGGLVALNKPYGIRRRLLDTNEYAEKNNIPHGVNYTLSDTILYIRDQLKYPELIIVKCPEMYTSGVTLLAANERVAKEIITAYARSHFFSNTYWIITVGVPKRLQDNLRLGIRLISHSEFQEKKAILTTKWSVTDEKFNRIKLFKTQYKVLSNSTHNLCSLIEMKASTQKRHAIRLFAATHLYCPVLGDNICSLQIHKVGNTNIKVDPFLSYSSLPKLDRQLCKLLAIKPRQQIIIPAHVHLRSVKLPSFFGKDLELQAPLTPSFEWTCKQLEFKHITQNETSCK